MNGKEAAFHYVCTRDQARDLVKKFDRFWASNCGCREDREGGCRRSRIDLCLMFRDEETRTRVDGICFCCDDCCGYFLDEDEVCDKGDLIQKTQTEGCSNCAVCVEVCYFGARKMDGDALVINREECYGCGLCVDVCPQECVEMVVRESEGLSSGN